MEKNMVKWNMLKKMILEIMRVKLMATRCNETKFY